MGACLLDDISYVKQDAVAESDNPLHDGVTDQYYYLVFQGARKLPFCVWKQKCFTYLGTQGWDRGVRIRDFHPIEWVAGPKPFEYIRLSYKTRREAVKNFLQDHAAEFLETPQGYL